MSNGRFENVAPLPDLPLDPTSAADINAQATAQAAALAQLVTGCGLGDLVRTAAETAVRAHLSAAAQGALDDALAGDLGQALDDEIAQAVGAALAAPAPGPQLMFANVADWVQDLLLPHYRRPHSEFFWCQTWWEHAEAVARLEATWRAWEHLRHEGPTGPAVWFRDYCDPMMRELTSSHGPFAACNPRMGQHQVLDVWPNQPPPEGLFRAADHPEEQ